MVICKLSSESKEGHEHAVMSVSDIQAKGTINAEAPEGHHEDKTKGQGGWEKHRRGYRSGSRGQVGKGLQPK